MQILNTDEEILEVINNHGNNLFVITQSDWYNFIETLKEKCGPDLFKDIIENCNFKLTPLTFEEEKL